MGFFGWLGSHKLLIFFIAATSAFGIATVLLAVENKDLKKDSTVCKDKNETESGGMENYRLPLTVIPKDYDLTLYPDLNTGLFKGKLIANVTVKENVKQIKIHNNGLNIRNVAVDGAKANTEMMKKYELLIIKLADGNSVKKGDRTITIEYDGDMKNRIVGLYNSSYVNAEQERRVIATSKFEPTYARQAFPCFDEPNMKATYTVHILKPRDDSSYIALSNMPQLEEEEPVENGIMVHFEKSVKMSTYLSCFIVCDFVHKNDTFNSGPEEKRTVPLRVFATPAQLEKTDYALHIAKDVIEYFVEYFNIDYPLPKLDLIAIPDFVSGAMEHWGLVTFRETALLFDKAISSSINQQRVATVVAHELAHSWFGNLVTMDWWNDLWLNEGFATYIAYKGISIVEPTWQMPHQFLIFDLHSVLSKDATPASHPIVQTVVTPDQITEIFDSITYNKGASLLRMLEGAVGEENFQNGVTAYLKQHKWGNAITADLLRELQTIVGNTLDVKTFMDTWTLQMGYPILTIEEEGDSYVITQKRFLKDPEDPGSIESHYGYKWTVPLTYITDKDQTNPVLVWFKHNESQITIKKPEGIKWIKFNHNQVGYYRVNYPVKMWECLVKNIDKMESISDKTHLLEEAFSIAESGDELDYDVPLDLTLYLKNEFNYIPWSVAATKLDKLKMYLIDSSEYSTYLKYVRSILKPAYKNLTWDEKPNDDHLRKRARTTVIALACEVGVKECRKKAQEAFSAWLNNNQPIPQNLRPIVFSYGMIDSTEEDWNKVLEKFKNENDANEKLNLLRGLASVKDPQLLRKLIDLGKDENIIRGQDYFTMLQYVSANPIGTYIVWDYVRENWDYLVKRFTLNDRYLGRLIPAITGSFTTERRLEEIEDFFKSNPESGAGAGAREEALANVRNNIKWIERNRAKVEDWIRNNSNFNQTI